MDVAQSRTVSYPVTYLLFLFLSLPTISIVAIPWQRRNAYSRNVSAFIRLTWKSISMDRIYYWTRGHQYVWDL